MSEERIFKVSLYQDHWFKAWLKQRAYLSVLAVGLLPIISMIFRSLVSCISIEFNAYVITMYIVGPVLIVAFISMAFYRSTIAAYHDYEIRLGANEITQFLPPNKRYAKFVQRLSIKPGTTSINLDNIGAITQPQNGALAITSKDSADTIMVLPQIEDFDQIVEHVKEWCEIKSVNRQKRVNNIQYIVLTSLLIIVLLSRSKWIAGFLSIPIHIFTVLGVSIFVLPPVHISRSGKISILVRIVYSIICTWHTTALICASLTCI